MIFLENLAKVVCVTIFQPGGCNVRAYVKFEKLLNPKNRWLIDLVFN